MLNIRNNDIVKTVDGQILHVTRSSKSFLFGVDITKNTNFMCDRNWLERKTMEVYYNGKSKTS